MHVRFRTGHEVVCANANNARSGGAVVKPGNPPYLEYVRSTVQQKREKFKKDTGLSLERLSDWEKSRYNMAKGGQVDETEVHGNPNLIYSSKFVEGWEPSGVPVRSPCSLQSFAHADLSSRVHVPVLISTIQDAIEVSYCTGVEE